MIVKLYGSPDRNPALLEAIKAYAESQGAVLLTVMAHQRVPITARHCKSPGSLTYEFLLNDDKNAQAGRQAANLVITVPWR